VRDSCTEIVLSGKRCREPVSLNATSDDKKCYYHDKVARGLTNTAEAIGAIEEDHG
jgi:hypothetical protein